MNPIATLLKLFQKTRFKMYTSWCGNCHPKFVRSSYENLGGDSGLGLTRPIRKTYRLLTGVETGRERPALKEYEHEK
jgi:hypothetical protein